MSKDWWWCVRNLCQVWACNCSDLSRYEDLILNFPEKFQNILCQGTKSSRGSEFGRGFGTSQNISTYITTVPSKVVRPISSGRVSVKTWFFDFSFSLRIARTLNAKQPRRMMITPIIEMITSPYPVQDVPGPKCPALHSQIKLSPPVLMHFAFVSQLPLNLHTSIIADTSLMIGFWIIVTVALVTAAIFCVNVLMSLDATDWAWFLFIRVYITVMS